MFLSEQNNGLDVLVDYLYTTQFIMRLVAYYYICRQLVVVFFRYLY